MEQELLPITEFKYYSNKMLSVSNDEISQFCEITKDKNKGIIHPPIIPGLQLEMLALQHAENVLGDKLSSVIANENKQLTFMITQILTQDDLLRLELIMDHEYSYLQLNILSKNHYFKPVLQGKLTKVKDLDFPEEFSQKYVINEQQINNFAQTIKQDKNPVYKFLLSYSSGVLFEYAKSNKLNINSDDRYIYSRHQMQIFPKILNKKINDKITYFIYGVNKESNLAGSYKIAIKDDKGDYLSKISLKLRIAPEEVGQEINKKIDEYQAKSQ